MSGWRHVPKSALGECQSGRCRGAIGPCGEFGKLVPGIRRSCHAFGRSWVEFGRIWAPRWPSVAARAQRGRVLARVRPDRLIALIHAEAEAAAAVAREAHEPVNGEEGAHSALVLVAYGAALRWSAVGELHGTSKLYAVAQRCYNNLGGLVYSEVWRMVTRMVLLASRAHVGPNLDRL